MRARLDLQQLLRGGPGSNSAARAVLPHQPLRQHAERNHQGLENRLIAPDEAVGQAAGEVIAHERLGGLVRYYHRKAA